MARKFYVYIVANHRRTLYIGVTSDIVKRLQLHASGSGSHFVWKYGLHRLVYIETAARAIEAIVREKQLKRWLRSRKLELIESINPEWRDLADDWGLRGSPDSRRP